MRILLSAYSCEPNRGSEPGLGWNTAVELAREHEVWVVTKERGRTAIERELAARPRPNLHFAFFEPPGFAWLGRREAFVQTHYYLWQYGVYSLARTLCRQHDFDVVSHVTFGRFWSPSLFALLPVPFIWSGLGGGEAIPPALRPGLSLKHHVGERLKSLVFGLYWLDPFVRMTARRSALMVVNHHDTAERVAALSTQPIEFMETAVVDREAAALIESLDEPPPRQPGEPVIFATLTRLLHWKGVHLGLRAFARLKIPAARYVIVGDGPERRSLEHLATELGVGDRVEFVGNASRAEWMRTLKRCHALVHPSLANAFNTIALEALYGSRPVICLDHEYMRSQLGEETTYFVNASDPEAVVAGMADAMQRVAECPAEASERGRLGRERARARFTWDRRTERWNQFLSQAVGARSLATSTSSAPPTENSHAI